MRYNMQNTRLFSHALEVGRRKDINIRTLNIYREGVTVFLFQLINYFSKIFVIPNVLQSFKSRRSNLEPTARPWMLAWVGGINSAV